jgi:phytoene/squalene synthetase
MCLVVFCGGSQKQYDELAPGAAALGSAFQKVNFLRDICDDYETRGRYYFPVGSYEQFDTKTKLSIEQDIAKDFAAAQPYIDRLPANAQRATRLAYRYYRALERKIQEQSAEHIKSQRNRVPNTHKYLLYVRVWIGKS